MAAVDAELNTALKQAKSKQMFFAFLGKGTDGKLLVSKSKISAKEIAEAKKELGGGNLVKGKCKGEGKTMVFEVAKDPPGTMAAALKKLLRETGLGLLPDIQVTGGDESDEDEAEDTSGGATPSADAAAQGQAPPAAPPPAGLAGIQTALKKLGFDPGKIDGVMGKNTQDAIKKFQTAQGLKADGIVGPLTQKALAAALKGGGAAAPGAPPVPGKAAPAGNRDMSKWQAARQTAIDDLKALASKVAKTKHGDAAAVLKEINSVIAKLPPNPGPQDIDKLEDFIRKDDSITAAEESPKHFHDLNIRQPLLDALESLR